jgi:hypothetical protein
MAPVQFHRTERFELLESVFSATHRIAKGSVVTETYYGAHDYGDLYVSVRDELGEVIHGVAWRKLQHLPASNGSQ